MVNSMIKQTNWNGLPAYELATERLSCVVLPTPGAKIVSIFDKKYNREWLVPPMREIRETEYGGAFTQECMCGWDEMLPTIDRCDWNGIEFPDHGELWGIPWRAEADSASLTLSVSGIHWPFKFSRKMALPEDNKIRMTYTLKNGGDLRMAWLWAAHPQFAVDEGTRIVLPDEVNEVINVLEGDPVLGTAGKAYSWPNGSPDPAAALDRIRSVKHQSCRKVYIPPEVHIDHAALLDERNGCGLKLSWDAVRVPYCGIWVDEGAYNARPVAAIEPTTGYYDSLITASRNNRLAYLDPDASVSWYIDVCVE